MDLIELRQALEAQKYIFDEEFLITVHVAMKLGKPLLIEGAAGVGKTEVAKVLASALGKELIRLQCYEGLDESKALYEWNYQKQLLSIQFEKVCNTKENDGVKGLFTEDYLLERPLMKAIGSPESKVLLIDEIDKTDEEFEAFLLELLSDFQVTIPEMGTIKAKSRPVIILTSNNTRQLSDALKRRCAYLYIDYPDAEKEARIIKARLQNVPDRLVTEAVTIVAAIRKNERIIKKPSIAETLDWISALMTLDKTRIDPEGAGNTLGFLIKNKEDMLELEKDGVLDGSIYR